MRLTALVWNFTARCLFQIFYISVMTKMLLSKLQDRRFVARNHILFTKFVPITEMFLFMCFNDFFVLIRQKGPKKRPFLGTVLKTDSLFMVNKNHWHGQYLMLLGSIHRSETQYLPKLWFKNHVIIRIITLKKSVIIKMNISFERIFGTKPCNNKNYYTVLLPYKSDKIRYNI